MGLARLSTQRQNWRCDFDKDFYTYSLPLLRWICASLFTNPARNHTRHIFIAAITVKIKTTHSLSPSSLDLKLFFTNPARIQTWLSHDMYKSSFSLPFFAGFGKNSLRKPSSNTNVAFRDMYKSSFSLPFFFAGFRKNSLRNPA
jgi:hypothetical protein